MRNKISLVVVVTILMLTLVNPVLASSSGEAVAHAVAWLKGQQNADGGFSNGFSPESNLSATAEAVIALAASGQDTGLLQSEAGASPLSFLYQQVRDKQLDGIGTKAKVIMALLAAGLEPSNFAGQNLVGQLEAAYDAETGSYGGSIFDQALVILALANAGRTVPENASNYLMIYQTTDGAWNFMGDTAALTGDTNTTALVIQALVAVGRKDDTGRAVAYLQRVQNDNGGWPYQNPSPYGTETDANSTAYVLQAILAVGQTPADWYVDGVDPLGALLALQNANGSFSYQASWPGDNALATIQAIPAIAGVTLASIARVPTSSDLQAAADVPPSTLPEAGGVMTLSLVSSALGVGLLLIVVGLRIKHTRQSVV